MKTSISYETSSNFEPLFFDYDSLVFENDSFILAEKCSYPLVFVQSGDVFPIFGYKHVVILFFSCFFNLGMVFSNMVPF